MVRPILVPAYLILVYSGRFGRLGRFLGAPKDVERQDTAPLTGGQRGNAPDRFGKLVSA